MKTLSYRYLPLNLYLGYTAFVLMALFWGPIKYKGLNYFILLPFIFAVILLFIIGYFAGAKGTFLQTSSILDSRFFCYKKILRLFNVLLMVGVISSMFQWYFFISSGGGLSLSKIGLSYVSLYDGYERGTANIDFLYIIKIFEQATITLVLLFSFYYYGTMSKRARCAFLFIVGSYLIINLLGTGKQKYLGDVILFTGFSQAIKFATNRIRFKQSTLWLFFVSFVLVFFVFVEILRQRYFAAGIGLDNFYIKAHPLIEWEEGSILFKFVNPDYVLALGIFLSYFSNGLYGLYLSLTLPFKWTYLFGNSYSLGRIIEIIFSNKGMILENTYPFRVGEVYGWGLNKWHSLYSWLASDFTFFGVVFLCPFFAYFYARIWRKAVNSSNPFAGPFFIYLSMGLMFSYANNQIMHGLSGVIVLIFLICGFSYYGRVYPRGI